MPRHIRSYSSLSFGEPQCCRNQLAPMFWEGCPLQKNTQAIARLRRIDL
jgi:hypothetical protein